MPKYFCIINHYNKTGTLYNYVKSIISDLRSQNFEVAIISNSGFKKNEDILELEEKYECSVFTRENKGYDFGAWKWAISRKIIPHDTDFLILANDSVLGPIFPLHPIISKMEKENETDFWGLTESYQGAWHLQSYFLCFKKSVFTNKVFTDFFAQNFNEYSKQTVVEQCEIGLSQLLKKAGFKGKSAFTLPENQTHEKGIHFNPTHFWADFLITQQGFPFLKKDLLLENPDNIEFVSTILETIEENSTFPISEIIEVLVGHTNVIFNPTTPEKKLSVICHLFYKSTIYNFLGKIAILKKFRSRFYFNISTPLFNDEYFIKTLKLSFPESIILHTPNKGRDIGGKIAALDVALKTNDDSDIFLFIHDKLSPHTPLGREWRDKLLDIIHPEKIQKAISLFDDQDTGIVCAKEYIQNEYSYDTSEFNSRSNHILKRNILKYNLHTDNFSFSAGTIFWVKAEVFREFFRIHPPLSIYTSLEEGNMLDFDKGTELHSWERIFSWIATSKNLKIKGI